MQLGQSAAEIVQHDDRSFRCEFADIAFRTMFIERILEINISTNDLESAENTVGRARVDSATELIMSVVGDVLIVAAELTFVQSRERYLTPQEIPVFFEALKRMSNQTVKDYIFLSLFTGARRSNILAMRWEDIDIDLATWRIPKTKNGDSQVATHFLCTCCAC